MSDNPFAAMQTRLDRNHPRVKKARLGRMLLRPTNANIINIAIALGVVSSIAGFIISFPLVGLIASPTLVLIMLKLWANGELREMPAYFPQAKPQVLDLHLALDRRVLGRLDDADTPQQIWKAVRGMWRQRFFSDRYGIGYEIFDTKLSDDPAVGQAVWDRAYELAKREGQDSITGATITVALLSTIHGYDDYLAELHLEPSDLVIGIDWQRHIELLVERIRNKSSFGGLARDWASGYTPILNRLGHNMSLDVQNGGFLSRFIPAQRQTVDQMIATLSGAARPNVVLVGGNGVGKSTLVYDFTQRLLLDPHVPKNIRYHKVISVNAPLLISQVSDSKTLESIILGVLAEARAAKNVIIFFDRAELFFQSGTGKIDLSSILLPAIENGSVRMIFAMGDNEWHTLSANSTALASLLNYQVAAEPDQENTMRIMQDQALLIEAKHGITFMYQSLLEAYRLSERYVHDLAFPGKAIRVLEAAVNFADAGMVTEASIQQSLESTLGVKVQGASKEEKQALLNLEDQIHERMINQTRAVKVVSDALRRARSGVGNPNKPIGTFLFLGPTGVGKTELAKALSHAYFGGDYRIVRVDMNEFVRSEDVSRLLAPAVEQGTSLLASIRKQPFSVVLFDEIEKAHPDVVNVFLQLLDEGIMRDTANREVSFRDAIVIATSNAGADMIREHIEKGEELEQFEKQFMNDLINSNQFRPEFLNRFDETVLFRPLKPEELLLVVDLLIEGVNKTLARQKVGVALTDNAKKWLVDNGYDARLGARPLRRMVQRSVENIVARKILQSDFKPGSTLTLDADDLANADEA